MKNKKRIVIGWGKEAIDDFWEGPIYYFIHLRFPVGSISLVWKYKPFHLMVWKAPGGGYILKTILEIGKKE